MKNPNAKAYLFMTLMFEVFEISLMALQFYQGHKAFAWSFVIPIILIAIFGRFSYQYGLEADIANLRTREIQDTARKLWSERLGDDLITSGVALDIIHKETEPNDRPRTYRKHS